VLRGADKRTRSHLLPRAWGVSCPDAPCPLCGAVEKVVDIGSRLLEREILELASGLGSGHLFGPSQGWDDNYFFCFFVSRVALLSPERLDR